MKPAWTILKMLEWTMADFKNHQIESPRLEAEVLLADLLEISRVQLYINYDRPLSEQELARFKERVLRRRLHEPVSYITHKREFYSLDFFITPGVLIPRPETELLVEAALQFLNKLGQNPPKIFEIGIGSGCIAVTLAKKVVSAVIFANDVADIPIKVALQNIQNHQVAERVHLIKGACFDGLRPETRFDLIISNPPYIGETQYFALGPDVRYEPKTALLAGETGFELIEKIVKGAGVHLLPGGVLALEIGWDQGERVTHLVKSLSAYQGVEIKKDYSGLDRVAIITR